ncbi:MAG: peptidoglycan-binding domain-containing protein, partial [Patescibacteria group bacterium]
MSNLLKSKFFLGVMIVAVLVVGAVAFSNTAAAADCTITSTLRVGSKGEQVKCLQAAVGVTADGSFGKMTKAAVQAWQSAKGLVADGIFGPKSRASFTGSSVSTGLPAGCTSTAGFSSTTGTKCDAVVVVTAPVTGCEGGAVYNSNTGAPCVGAVVPTTGSVTVSLASDNPAAGTLLVDNTTGVMQNAAPIAKFVFSNGTGAEVKINTVKLTRKGIAADGDINNLFLYEGTTKLAELSSVATKVFSFNNSAGLFSIPANSSKAIWVGINMAVATSGPTSIGFSIDSAADVVLSSGTTAGGSFPVKGNEFLTAFITDLGYIDLTSTTTFPATLDPKPEAQEVWRFTATANSQKMKLKRIVMTLVGTTSPGDIQDLTLSVGGVQVGDVAQLGTDNKVTFDWSATPYELLSGQNKVFVLMAKVVKGTGRAFKFTIRSTADFVSTDTNYNADTVPLLAAAALTVVDPDSTGDGTNINN